MLEYKLVLLGIPKFLWLMIRRMGTIGFIFNTTNEDQVQISSVPMIGVDDIVSLPKGQAFVLLHGNEIYKIRVPLLRPTIRP
ncbi:TPA: hypothetical protein GDC94_16925, partial [Legionella pneumophila]|nr:hypothetical protein [Legionella pneumophila]HAT8368163.1 hypothetical protein [Legionella pneumophila]HEO1360102.1 hypothetical protein [Legionella pneumophila]